MMETVLVHLTVMRRRMKMKMSAVCAVTLLLLSCKVSTATDAQKCDYHTTVGGSVTVVQHFLWDRSLRLRWMHGSTRVYDSKQTKDNKYNVDRRGSLELTNMKKGNDGQYVSEVWGSDGVSKGKNMSTVCITDRIPKPEVKFKCTSSSVMFTCKMTQEVKGVTYQWSEGGQVLENQSNATLVRRSDQLGGNTFSCKVSVSTLSQTSNAVQQTCLKPEKPKLFGLDFWLMVGILAGGGGLVLLLIVVTIICCVKTRRKKQMQGEEEQELRLEWSNTQQQQQQQQQQHPPHPHPHPHPHHHPHAPHPHHPHPHQQPAGHTGPRQPRPKQPRPRAPEHGSGHPQPSPRRPAQTSRPAIAADDEKPPPLPQPRKKTPRM